MQYKYLVCKSNLETNKYYCLRQIKDIIGLETLLINKEAFFPQRSNEFMNAGNNIYSSRRHIIRLIKKLDKNPINIVDLC
jgi:hypothetical protein